MTDGFVAERVIRDWIDFYITEHPHSALDGQTPEDAYWADRPVGMLERFVGLSASARVPQQQKRQSIHLIFAA